MSSRDISNITRDYIMIAKFTIGLNTGLAVWVWSDVFKQYKKKAAKVNKK